MMAIQNQRVELDSDEYISNNIRNNDRSRNGSRKLAFLYSIVRFICIVIQNIYCVSSYLILSWILLYPLNLLNSELYSQLENHLYNSLLYIVSSWSLAAELRVVETGDDYKKLIEENNYGSNNKKCDLKSNKFNGCPNKDKTLEGSNPHDDDEEEEEEEEKDSEKEANESTDSNDLINTNRPIKNSTKTPSFSSICNNNSVTKNGIQPFNNYPHMNTKPRVLLLCNHVSTADVPLLMQSFTTLKSQCLLWVLDAQFKPTNFGLVCSSHGDFFIAKNTFADGVLRDQVLQHPDRNILVLFPEGGFLRKRLEGSNRYAVKNGLPLTKYVTHPRFGAFKDLIDPEVNVTHIVDATLLYNDIRNPPSILDIVLGNRAENAVIHYRVYERAKISPTEEWLRNIWLEKEKLIQHYYEDRESVYKYFGNSIRTAKLDWVKVICVHLFYMVVCYLTVYRLLYATGITMSRARDLQWLKVLSHYGDDG